MKTAAKSALPSAGWDVTPEGAKGQAAQQEFNTTYYADYTTPHSLFALLSKGMQSITHLSLLTEHHSQLLAEQM